MRDRPHATAATELLLPALRTLEGMGTEIARRASESGLAILAESGLALASFQDLRVRIPHETALRLLDNAVRVSDDPGFALRAGRSVQRGDFGVYHLLTSTAPTLGASMQLAARYLPLLHDGATIQLIEDGEFVRWEHSLLPGVESSSAANEYVVSSFSAGAQQMLGLYGYPIEVRFMHPAPAHAARYEAVFGPSPKFDAERNTIVMSKASLSAPLIGADATMHAALTQYADELMMRLPGVHPFVERTRQWVKKELARGALLEKMSRAFHMSESGVQRRLAAVGTSHTEIVDGVRRKAAAALLIETDLNASEIAFRLGFAHPPAFHRAFARWYGCSPTTHREKHAGGGFYRFFRGGVRGIEE